MNVCGAGPHTMYDDAHSLRQGSVRSQNSVSTRWSHCLPNGLAAGHDVDNGHPAVVYVFSGVSGLHISVLGDAARRYFVQGRLRKRRPQTRLREPIRGLDVLRERDTFASQGEHGVEEEAYDAVLHKKRLVNIVLLSRCARQDSHWPDVSPCCRPRLRRGT